MNTDLTVGKPERVLVRFCLPLFWSIIFQQLYNIADSLVAGKFVGELALAAVGNSYEITLIFLAFAFGCNIATSVLVSTLFGAKQMNQMKTAVSTAMVTSGVVCLILMGLGGIFSTQLLGMIRTPREIFEDSRLYLQIYILGLPFMFFYNIVGGIFSALGDSRTPFYFLAASSTANIGMDILFVAGFHMGVAGVAWATFLCQGISCLLALGVVFKRLKGIKTVGRYPLFSRTLCRRFALIAIPSTLQQSFVSVGNIIIQSVINGFGPGVIAGYAAAIKLNNLVITSLSTLGNGISNFVAQNLGAGKKDRIRAGFRAGLKLVWAICLPLTLLYLFLGERLLAFFMDSPSQEAMRAGLLFLRIVSPFYFVVAAKLVADGVLRGTSQMRYFMIDTFTDLIIRVVLAILLSKTALGFVGIWCAWPVGWTLATLLSLWFYWITQEGKRLREKRGKD